RRGGAVVDIQAGVERLEGELRTLARRRERGAGAATRTGDAVQVDVVRHLRIGVVVQVELHRVALAHADEAAGHGAAEGPEGVGDALGDLHVDLADLELDLDLGRVVAVGRRRYVRRRGQHGLDDVALGRAEIALARTAGVARL